MLGNLMDIRRQIMPLRRSNHVRVDELAPHLPRLKQVVIQDLPSDSLAITLAADLAPAISSFIVDPGYSGDNDQCIRRVTNGPPSLRPAAFSTNSPLDPVP